MTNVATLLGTEEPVEEVVRKLAEDARVASHALGVSGPSARDEALQNGAAEIRRCTADILAANEKLKERPPGSWPDRITKAVEKARRYGFYLGLNDFAWLDLLESGC